MSRKLSKRSILKMSGAALASSVAGCTAQQGGSPDSGSGDSGGPWTTEELAEKAQEEGQTKITLYNAINAEKPWQEAAKVIQEEYSWFEMEVFGSNGETIGQRVSQEMQADSLKASVLNQGGPITKDKKLAKRVLASGHDEKFAIMEDVDSEFQAIFDNLLVTAVNWGPSIGVGYNPQMVEEQGYDLFESYNDLFDSQYEGMNMLIPQGPNWTRLGWIAQFNAENEGMEPREWVEALADHLNFKVGPGYTATVKLLGSGEVAPFVIQNYPWIVGRFKEDLDVELYYPTDNMTMVSSGMVAELAEGPAPWGARFLISVLLEPFMQKALATDQIPRLGPGRPDIDYSDVEMAEGIEPQISARPDIVPFEKNFELVDIGKKAWEPVMGEGIDVEPSS